MPEGSEGQKAETIQDGHLLKGSELTVEKIHESPMGNQNKLVTPRRDTYVQYFRSNMPDTDSAAVTKRYSSVLALDECDDHQPVKAGTSKNSTGDGGHQLQV
jgi:hypothetical protein